MSRCDIVIPVWNQPELTKTCIDSIRASTGDVDYRMIIIDNASGAETKNYLEGLKNDPRVLLVRNETNLGFLKAVNQGMRLSDAPYVCLLNNDAVATEGWLGEMIRTADSSPAIGIVNPSSNTMGQKPGKGESIEGFARRIKKEPGAWEEIGSAIGFCMLIKREVIKNIGVFDEIYGMGNFEDTDFSRRAIKEGYLCARSLSSYVYHKEGTSFGRSSTFDENFERNRQIYEFRWGKRRWIAYVLPGFDEDMAMTLERDIMPEARRGFWVWCFSDRPIKLPRHSNIIFNVYAKHFYIKALWKILTRKKRFSEIFVTNGAFANILKRLSFIHKGKVFSY
jgi:GT2 family glycosyltransferase